MVTTGRGRASRGAGGLVGAIAERSEGGGLAHGVVRGALGHVGHVEAKTLPGSNLVALAVSTLGGGADLAVGHRGHRLADRVDGSSDGLAGGETGEGLLGLACSDQGGSRAEDVVGLGADSGGQGNVIGGTAEGGQDGQGSAMGSGEGGISSAGGVKGASGQEGGGLADVADSGGQGGVGKVVGGAGGVGGGGQADGGGDGSTGGGRGASGGAVVTRVSRDGGGEDGGNSQEQ